MTALDAALLVVALLAWWRAHVERNRGIADEERRRGRMYRGEL